MKCFVPEDNVQSGPENETKIWLARMLPLSIGKYIFMYKHLVHNTVCVRTTKISNLNCNLKSPLYNFNRCKSILKFYSYTFHCALVTPTMKYCSSAYFDKELTTYNKRYLNQAESALSFLFDNNVDGMERRGRYS